MAAGDPAGDRGRGMTQAEHSRKPDEVRGWLVDLYGDVPRIELFARTSVPGWISCGNETEKFNEHP